VSILAANRRISRQSPVLSVDVGMRLLSFQGRIELTRDYRHHNRAIVKDWFLRNPYQRSQFIFSFRKVLAIPASVGHATQGKT
jgi:hypothetical protein